MRAWVGADGSVSLPGGEVFRIGPSLGGQAARLLPEAEPPAVEWHQSIDRIRLAHTAFASARGVFVRTRARNPYREARSLSLEVAIRSRRPPGLLRMTRTGLAAVDGKRRLRLVDVAGAKALRSASHRGGDEAVLEVEAVLPPRASRAIEFVLAPSGRTRAHSLDAAYAETVAGWNALRGALAGCRLPDGGLAAAFERAWFALVGSVSSRAGAPESGPWPRPGLEPRAGPATLDALALRALDEWGGWRLVDDCLRLVTESQGSAAPPGGAFRSARGFLSLPPEEDPRDRWGSDCGALLWAMCSRSDVGAPKRYFRSVRRSVEDACAWMAGELRAGKSHDGLLPASPGPRLLGKAARAWNDGWSWRGLDAAARVLEELAAPAAAGMRDVADRYRRAIERHHGGSPHGRLCLRRLGVTDAPGEDAGLAAGRLAALHGWAEDLASASLTPEEEFRTAVLFLRTLRRLLIAEEADEVSGTPRALHVFPGCPPAWFEENARLEIERMPTSAGPVTVRAVAAPGGGRLVVEAELPKGAPAADIRLGRSIGEVRVNGRRSGRVRPRLGLVLLPKGGGRFDISAETAGVSSRRRSRGGRARPK